MILQALITGLILFFIYRILAKTDAATTEIEGEISWWMCVVIVFIGLFMVDMVNIAAASFLFPGWVELLLALGILFIFPFIVFNQLMSFSAVKALKYSGFVIPMVVLTQFVVFVVGSGIQGMPK